MIFDLQLPESRFERKFIVDSTPDKVAVETSIKLHPALFSEIYEARQVNNIYLDTSELDFYHDNVIGRSDRKKVRIRWYGSMEGIADNPVLEYKIKRGELGWKYAFPLPSFEVGMNLSESELKQVLAAADLNENIKEELKILHPVVMNSYQRKYYQSADRLFRITMDWDFTYLRFGHFGNTLLGKDNVSSEFILELKYAFDTKDEASQITSGIPYRVAKNSKYVNGVSCFEPGIAL